MQNKKKKIQNRRRNLVDEKEVDIDRARFNVSTNTI